MQSLSGREKEIVAQVNMALPQSDRKQELEKAERTWKAKERE